MLKINGRNYDRIVKYELEKNQIWAEDSGRSYGDGSWNGTILGNFTKPMVSLYFDDPVKLSQFEDDMLSGSIEVSFYDTRTRTMRTKTSYRNNYKIIINAYYDEGLEQFFDLVEVNFITHERD
jgi:hypothetical protein